MSSDMNSGNTWPEDHPWKPCRICYGPTPKQAQDGCCDRCNGLEPEARPRPVVDYVPVAVVYPGRKVSVRQREPYTYWARGEWATGPGRSLMVANAQRYARVTGGRVEVLHQLPKDVPASDPTARQAGLTRSKSAPVVASVATGADADC